MRIWPDGFGDQRPSVASVGGLRSGGCGRSTRTVGGERESFNELRSGVDPAELLWTDRVATASWESGLDMGNAQVHVGGCRSRVAKSARSNCEPEGGPLEILMFVPREGFMERRASLDGGEV